MFCKHCGHELSATDKFCAYCGQPAESAEQTENEAPKAENLDFQIPHVEEPKNVSQPIVKKIASKPVFLVFSIAFTIMLASFAISVFSGSILSVLSLIFGIFVDIALWTLYGLSKKENESENPALFNKIRSYAVCQRVFAIIGAVGIGILIALLIIFTVVVGTNLSTLNDVDLSDSAKIKDAISEAVEESGVEELYGDDFVDEIYDEIDNIYEKEIVGDLLSRGLGMIVMIALIVLLVFVIVVFVVDIISAVRYKKMALFCDDLRLSWISGVPMKSEHTGLRKLSVVYGVLMAIFSFGSIGVTLFLGGLFSSIVAISEIVAIFAFASVVKELDKGMKEASESTDF